MSGGGGWGGGGQGGIMNIAYSESYMHKFVIQKKRTGIAQSLKLVHG